MSLQCDIVVLKTKHDALSQMSANHILDGCIYPGSGLLISEDVEVDDHVLGVPHQTGQHPLQVQAHLAKYLLWELQGQKRGKSWQIAISGLLRVALCNEGSFSL